MNNPNTNRIAEENTKVVFSVNTKRDYFIDWLTRKTLLPGNPHLKKVLDKLPNKRFSDGLAMAGLHPEEPQLIVIGKLNTTEDNIFFNIITIGENRIEISAGYTGSRFDIFSKILIMIVKTYIETAESILHYLESEMLPKNSFTEKGNSDKQESNAISIEGNVQESTVILGNSNTVHIYSSDVNKPSEALSQQLSYEQRLSTWELLFENNEDGSPIGGDLKKLIEAVHRGYPIKIRIHLPKNTIKVIDGESVNIDNGIVHATNTKEISLGKNDSGNYVYQEKAYHYYIIASSNGHFHERRIFLDGKDRNTTDKTRRMAWFGLVPPSFMN